VRAANSPSRNATVLSIFKSSPMPKSCVGKNFLVQVLEGLSAILDVYLLVAFRYRLPKSSPRQPRPQACSEKDLEQV